jgi:hypothetical protein
VHLTTGKTGWASLPRSLAALMADELRLVATPRRAKDPQAEAHDGLQPDGDQRLTEWMRASPRLAV